VLVLMVWLIGRLADAAAARLIAGGGRCCHAEWTAWAWAVEHDHARYQLAIMCCQVAIMY